VQTEIDGFGGRARAAAEVRRVHRGAQGVAQAGEEGRVAFEGSDEDGVGEVEPLAERHGRTGHGVVGGVEVADAAAGVVDADAEPEGGQGGEAGIVTAFDAGGCGEQADDTALGRGGLGGAAGEAGGGPPGRQGAGQAEGGPAGAVAAPAGSSRRAAPARPTASARSRRVAASVPGSASFWVAGPTRRAQVAGVSGSP